MASKYWIKLYHEVLDDPKMGRLPDTLWRRVIELFLMAGDYEQDGYLPSLGDIAWRLRLDESELESEMLALSEFGIVQQMDGRWYVSKFAERQAPVSNAERQARYRSRLRSEEYHGNDTDNEPNNSQDNAPVTERNTDIDIDTDIDTEHGGDDAPPLASRLPTGKNAIKAELEAYFVEITNVPPPASKTAAQKRAAGARWWNPLIELAGWVDNDVGQAKALMRATVEQMRKAPLTISTPSSIMNNARSLFAEREAKRQKQTKTKAQAEDDPQRELFRQLREAEAKKHDDTNNGAGAGVGDGEPQDPGDGTGRPRRAVSSHGRYRQ